MPHRDLAAEPAASTGGDGNASDQGGGYVNGAPAGGNPGGARSDTGGAQATEPDADEYFWPAPPKRDKWAHRRGEPRLFAFVWVSWLAIASVRSLNPLGVPGLTDVSASQHAGSVLFMLIAAGMVALWPMVRLSQAMPRSIGRACMLDALVVLVPVQLILWPWRFVGWWAWVDLSRVSLAFVAWAVLLAGLVAIAMRDIQSAERRVEQVGIEQAQEGRAPTVAAHGRRAAWMTGIVALCSIGALATLVAGPLPEPGAREQGRSERSNAAGGQSARGGAEIAALMSPITGVRLLLDTRSGLRFSPWQAGGVAALVLAAGAVLLVAGGSGDRGHRSRQRLH
ncbi:MAG: hypothetical protein SFZ23_15610 [Planctomycetota bacterium]|nr:hypothetical protein [Planctomycetota bacterium]